jgi:hypothetical protein
MRRDLDPFMLHLAGQAVGNIAAFPIAPARHAGTGEACALLDGMLDSEGYFVQSDEDFLTDLGVFDSTFTPPRT